MKFESEIRLAFKDLQVTPRPGQAEAVSLVLEQFWDYGMKNVVLSADTGTGKSIIAAAVAKCFQYRQTTGGVVAFTLMQNNALVKQYAETFDRFDDKDFYQVKGAGNYPCLALAELTNDLEANAESCAIDTLPEPAVLKFCSKCEFKKAKSLRNETKNLITNYSYYFVSKMWSEHLTARPLTIFDEAHTLNEVFCSHNAIYFSVERLNEYIDEIRALIGPLADAELKTLGDIRRQLKAKEIDDYNYIDVAKRLLTCYKDIFVKLDMNAETQSLASAVKTKAVAKKYFNLGCKIGDLLVHKYDHVFEHIEADQAISIKPVFIGHMSKLILGDLNLFMSATISDKYVIETLALDPDTVGFVKLPPVFDPESKEIIFVGDRFLNFSQMNDLAVIRELSDTCSKIVKAHADLNEKGLILVPSYKLAQQVADSISTTKARVFVHTRNDKLNDLIEAFKAYDRPAVLISPSIFEGLDFSGDQSRYQIIMKAPFPSLGERRMKHIADKYPEIYRLMTLKKVIQGIGRSVRSEDDYATTYILDQNIKRLFESDLNVWKDQFSVKKI